MTTDTISVTEFARDAGIPYSTAARWCQPGPGNRIPAEKQDDGTWAIPRAEADRVIAARRKAQLDEDRRDSAVEFLLFIRLQRATRAGERLARAMEEASAAYAALSAAQQADVADLRSLVAPLALAVKEVEELAFYAGVLDELNRQAPDAERIRNALRGIDPCPGHEEALLPAPQANGFPAGWPDGVKAQLAPMHPVTAPTEQTMTADQWAAAHASDTMESIDRGILNATRTINQKRGECCIATALINRIIATYDELERVRQDNHHLREEKAIVWDTIITGSVPPVSNSQPGTRE